MNFYMIGYFVCAGILWEDWDKKYPDTFWHAIKFLGLCLLWPLILGFILSKYIDTGWDKK